MANPQGRWLYDVPEGMGTQALRFWVLAAISVPPVWTEQPSSGLCVCVCLCGRVRAHTAAQQSGASRWQPG